MFGKTTSLKYQLVVASPADSDSTVISTVEEAIAFISELPLELQTHLDWQTTRYDLECALKTSELVGIATQSMEAALTKIGRLEKGADLATGSPTRWSS